jgi:hypothetical protein
MANIDNMTELGGAKILEFVALTLEEKRTGNTKHIIAGDEHVEFNGLAICQYDGEDAVYLFYCDSDWNVLTDTWHENVEAARDQASFEFEGLETKWRKK